MREQSLAHHLAVLPGGRQGGAVVWPAACSLRPASWPVNEGLELYALWLQDEAGQLEPVP